MKYILFSILLFFTSQYKLFCQTDKDTNHFLVWQEGIKIKWDDYICTKYNAIQKGYSFAAHTAYILRLTKNHNIISLFDKLNSFHSIENNNDSLLLFHEQLHFDIVELFARKIRHQYKIMEESKDVSTYFRYNEIFQNYLKELSNYQKLYDKETEHGIDRVKQFEWEIKVKKELIELSPYVLDEITLKKYSQK